MARKAARRGYEVVEARRVFFTDPVPPAVAEAAAVPAEPAGDAAAPPPAAEPEEEEEPAPQTERSSQPIHDEKGPSSSTASSAKDAK